MGSAGMLGDEMYRRGQPQDGPYYSRQVGRAAGMQRTQQAEAPEA